MSPLSGGALGPRLRRAPAGAMTGARRSGRPGGRQSRPAHPFRSPSCKPPVPPCLNEAPSWRLRGSSQADERLLASGRGIWYICSMKHSVGPEASGRARRAAARPAAGGTRRGDRLPGVRSVLPPAHEHAPALARVDLGRLQAGARLQSRPRDDVPRPAPRVRGARGPHRVRGADPGAPDRGAARSAPTRWRPPGQARGAADPAGDSAEPPRPLGSPRRVRTLHLGSPATSEREPGPRLADARALE